MNCSNRAVRTRLTPGLIVLAILTGSAQAQPAKKVDFAHDIVPLLKARCAECHTNGKYKGSFSLDTRADVLKTKAVVPGKSADSELIKRITSTDPDVRMPPKGEPLSAKEVALLKAWIDQGFAWEEGFSFKVADLRRRRSSRAGPTLPPARDGRDHPIDRILDAYFAQHKVAPPDAARRRGLRPPRLPRPDRPAAGARGAGRLPEGHRRRQARSA